MMRWVRWVYTVGVAGIAGTFLADIWIDVDYELAANISLIYAATLTTVFAIRYGFWSNWRSNEVGRTLFIKSLVLPVFLWQIVLSVWWASDYPLRQQLRFVIYTMIAVAYVTMVTILVIKQLANRNDPEELVLPPGVPPL